jgi:hypothetical protein
MSYITIAEPPADTVEEWKQVHALITRDGGEPDGLQSRYVGTVDGQVRLIAVWESKAHADKFSADRLRPTLVKAFGPEAPMPRAENFEVEDTYVRD